MKQPTLFIYVFCASLLGSCSNNNNQQGVLVKTNPKQSDWNAENITGKIKSVNDSIYAATGGHEESGKGGLKSITKTIYDENGFITEERTFNMDDSSMSHTYSYTYKYDSKGNVTEKNRLANNASYNTKALYKYDRRGYRLEQSIYDGENILKMKTCYMYDDKGNDVQDSSYLADGTPLVTLEYKYNDKGKVIEVTGGRYKEGFRYDANGNMIEKNDYDLNGGSSSPLFTIGYKYNFDTAGNWVKKIESGSGNVSAEESPEIIEREIEYYK